MKGIRIGKDRHLGGYVIIANAEGPDVEYDTYQCCHCNAHFQREVGKGPKAMCLMCNDPTCGEKACNPCIPFEAKLEAMEGRRRFWKQMELV